MKEGDSGWKDKRQETEPTSCCLATDTGNSQRTQRSQMSQFMLLLWSLQFRGSQSMSPHSTSAPMGCEHLKNIPRLPKPLKCSSSLWEQVEQKQKPSELSTGAWSSLVLIREGPLGKNWERSSGVWQEEPPFVFILKGTLVPEGGADSEQASYQWLNKSSLSTWKTDPNHYSINDPRPNCDPAATTGSKNSASESCIFVVLPMRKGWSFKIRR